MESSNAWLSYALDAPGLMAKAAPLTSEDVVIESIDSSSAAAGAFDLVVDIAGAEIGEGATSARLAEALGVEGVAELNESAFSSDGLSVSFSRTADITAERSEGRATHREASGLPSVSESRARPRRRLRQKVRRPRFSCA